jgi:hypothetical protein
MSGTEPGPSRSVSLSPLEKPERPMVRIRARWVCLNTYDTRGVFISVGGGCVRCEGVGCGGVLVSGVAFCLPHRIAGMQRPGRRTCVRGYLAGKALWAWAKTLWLSPIRKQTGNSAHSLVDFDQSCEKIRAPRSVPVCNLPLPRTCSMTLLTGTDQTRHTAHTWIHHRCNFYCY